MVTLAPQEFGARAERIRMVLTDVDGVLTDAGIYYSAAGEELKRFTVRDGMGVELLRDAGIETAFLTREESPIVVARSRKLKVRVFSGVRDKLAELPDILAAFELDERAVAFIGDDVNDLPLLKHLGATGLSAAPADAIAAVRESVHLVTSEVGGHGAFRAFADAILAARLHDSAR